MSATNKTTNYNLPLFISTDVPSWLGDWNGAMTSIDAAIKEASQSGGSSISVVQSTGTSNTAVMSQNATTQALSAKQATLVSGTNLKTINGQSLLGAGNVDVSGGGGTTDAGLKYIGKATLSYSGGTKSFEENPSTWVRVFAPDDKSYIVMQGTIGGTFVFPSAALFDFEDLTLTLPSSLQSFVPLDDFGSGVLPGAHYYDSRYDALTASDIDDLPVTISLRAVQSQLFVRVALNKASDQTSARWTFRMGSIMTIIPAATS